MSKLKNPKIAVVITVLVVALSLCFGAVRSVRAEAAKVERMFTEGVDGSGYGIAGDLEERADYARQLVKVAERYDGLETETKAVIDADPALWSDRSPSARYQADLALENAVTALDLAMQGAELSEKDEAYREQIMADFASPSYKIDKEAVRYNAEVQKYQDEVLGGFVAGLVDHLFPPPDVEAYQ